MTARRPVAAGRTAEVFADGPGRVRRVYRDGRDATAEATLMTHLLAHGYPVPAVYDADGPTIVMAAVDGPTLAGHALTGAAPAGRAGSSVAARLLRELHDRLAAVPAPPGLAAPFGEGGAVLHLDLHPYNVLLGPDGPVVIDWATAGRGPAEVDRAYTWVVMTTAVPPDPAVAGIGFEFGRRTFVDALLDGEDDPARRWIAAAARRRLDDPFVLAAERPQLRRLARITMR